MSIGAKLKELRMKRRQSLQHVADAVGVSKTHIWELETGRSSNPSLELVRRLAEHFEVKISYLVEETGDEESPGVFFRDVDGLSEDDMEILRKMADHLRQRATKK